jgi:hypothetical protein
MKHKIPFALGTALAMALLLSVSVAVAAALAGAIFTTTPDGGIVNENVRYEDKRDVYLDGGPPPNAPATAAGLPDGYYVFQITDPPGKMLLSQDPARCRVVRVQGGVIVQLVPPMEVPGLGATTNNWADNGRGPTEPCHVADLPTPPNGPGVRGPSGRHDTNIDVDHWTDAGAIVVQMMPYGTTPNPGGVYKAWITPLATYDAKVGKSLAQQLNDIPSPLPVGQQKPHRCPDFCAAADAGFAPPRDQVKTDNFKVKEFFPPEIRVRKFNDLNGNGVWDAGEPEIGVDQCVDATGAIVPCPGGWPYDFTEPVDGGTVTNRFYTPHTHLAGVPGAYTACEVRLTGWTQTAAYADGVKFDANQCASVTASGAAPGEMHEIVFGNFKNVSVQACKKEDKTGNGLTADDTPIQDWTVKLTKNGEVQDTKPTAANGCYTWTNLGPVPGGYYDVSEVVPPGWTATSDTSHNFESPPISGSSYSFTFTNFKKVQVTACKLRDRDGSLETTCDQTPIEGWTVNLTKNGVVQDTQRTGANGCYTWTGLGPVVGGYYDVSEVVPPGWIPLTPTSHNFESPPKSGASYSFTFVNTPSQGCTPGYWKVDQHWDSWTAPWAPGNPLSAMFAGVLSDPYAAHLAKWDQESVAMGSATQVQALSFQGGDTVAEKAETLLRAAVAAVLNAAHPGVAYAWTEQEVIDAVNAALAGQDPTTILNLAAQLDRNNNAPGGCPLN